VLGDRQKRFRMGKVWMGEVLRDAAHVTFCVLIYSQKKMIPVPGLYIDWRARVLILISDSLFVHGFGAGSWGIFQNPCRADRAEGLPRGAEWPL